MKKIINDPARFVDESVDGILLANPALLRAAPDNRRAVVRADAGRSGKVGIVTGGGSGHLPAFLGYVGRGLCDGVAVGNVFSSPSAEVIHAATRAVSGGAGVLYLYGNYGGDIYNFDLAGDLAEIDGIPTRTVLAADDVASAPHDAKGSRRGVAGMFYAFKIAGAAAERGDDLDRVTALAQRVSDALGTMGVGLSPTILPAAGEPSFELADGDMEIGVGIHGEPGSRVGHLEPADAIADDLLGAVIDDLALESGAAVSILVNGLGATPLEELYVLYRRAHAILTERGIRIRIPFVGNFVTSLEMAGASISLLRLDDEMEELLNAPAFSPFFRHIPYTEEEIEAVAAPVADDQAGPEVGDAASSVPTTPLGGLLVDVFTALPRHSDELRELDAALGDGDLGITISAGANAALEAIGQNPSVDDGMLLQRIGTAFAGANPSTFAALIGGGLLFAASRLGDRRLDDAGVIQAFGRDVASRIAERGGAEIGDKTVLDVIVASLDELEAHPGLSAADSLDGMIESVQRTIAAMTPLRSGRGRAAWLQERSVGRQDPGMAAYLAFLEEVRAAVA
jgi:dihydroxyacetone kinase